MFLNDHPCDGTNELIAGGQVLDIGVPLNLDDLPSPVLTSDDKKIIADGHQLTDSHISAAQKTIPKDVPHMKGLFEPNALVHRGIIDCDEHGIRFCSYAEVILPASLILFLTEHL